MFFEIGNMLYTGFLYEAERITVPQEYVNISEAVAKKLKWKTKINGRRIAGEVEPVNPNTKAMVAMSGGMDSVYLMNKLIDEGLDVTAVHISGLNRQSAIEEENAGAKYIRVQYKAPAQTLPDNPFKNQLILSIMLEIGVGKEIYRYGIGSDWTTPLKEAVAGYTITDSKEVNEEFWAGVKSRYKQAELIFIEDGIKKYERVQYLYKRGALETVSSCISPHRFRKSLHKKNEGKYSIRLMEGRCGSCYKCAMEYILLVESGLLKKDEKYYWHCWDTLATSKTAHRPDLFAKAIPIEKRLENIKNYGS